MTRDLATSPPPPRRRARDLGIELGRLAPGPGNAITDVSGVRVGHATLFSGAGARREGVGPVRTGVTVVLPHGGNLFAEKVVAAVHAINAFGRAAGLSQVEELGVLETPIAITNTLAVGAAWDGLVEHALRADPRIAVGTPGVNPLVGECNDSRLSDMRGRHVKAEHVLEAIAAAREGAVAEGVVGAGTGTVCYGWKGGVGTASRQLPATLGSYMLGTLVVTNLGVAEELTVAGVRVGSTLRPASPQPPAGGSCVVVVATDAPGSSRQLGRIARRVQSGLARTGTTSAHASGEYAIVFSTARTVPHVPGDHAVASLELAEDGPVLDALFDATVEAVEEAVVNSLFTADTVQGADNALVQGLPVDRVSELVRAATTRTRA